MSSSGSLRFLVDLKWISFSFNTPAGSVKSLLVSSEGETI